LDSFLRFVFLTGVSKFAKSGIFSGLNNLEDISLSPAFSAICGYRQEDLEAVFPDQLAGFDKDEVRTWYNGYAWCGDAVYNPFDVLLLFRNRQYRPWWFDTGTPAFLVTLLSEKPRTLPELDCLVTGDELLGSFRIEDLRPETLLFQAGYLTVKAWSSDAYRGTYYTLGFPNREVREAFSRLMLELYAGERGDTETRHVRLRPALESGDSEALRMQMAGFFASIPGEWYTKSPIARYEGYWASVVYALFASLGFEVIGEDSSNRGRADLTVKTRTGIWIFEFKVKGLDKSGDKNPLVQIRERGYAAKYSFLGLPVHEIGIVFDPEKREIEGWEKGDPPWTDATSSAT